MAKVPTKIGKYEITNKVAEGGMGAVYKGIHPTLNREVILKKLTLSDDEHITERFKREARIMMDFKNDNIVDVYDHFKAGGSYYIVLEYVDGMALDELIKKERYLSNDTALLIFLEACKALKYAHDKNVIHRDIKPGNILISRDGDIKLVDFGIASISDDDETNLTRDGMTLGTPSYMAPEQFNNSKAVDKRADIYSMGVMLYEMVTGKKPYPGNYSPETLAKIQKGKYLPPGKHNPAINRRITRIIRKCMKARADRRYKDLGGIISSLEKYFRKRNRETARKILVGKIRGENVEITSRNKPVFRKMIFILIALILITGGGYFLYRTGYYHEIPGTGDFGAFRIQIKIPRGEKSVEDLYLKAYLFVDDDKDIPAVDTTFHFQLKDETEKAYILESNRVYQPEGNYRIKIKYENELFWGTIRLNSLKTTRKLSGGSNTQVVSFEAQPENPRPLEIRSRIYDYSTGKEIGDRIDALLSMKGKWVPLTDWENDLESGNIYRIRYSGENYQSKEFSLKIDLSQSQLDVTVYLKPLTGKIKITSEESGFHISLDSDLPGWLADDTTLSDEGKEFDLYPGNYRLTVSGRGVKQEIPLEVNHNTDLHLQLKYDETKKNIEIEGLNNG